MKLHQRFKKLVAALLLMAFVPSQAWAQGITIPAGSTFHLNTGQLNVPGNITNAGTLTSSTGNISLTGNWANTGTFSAGTATVDFNATSGTQTLSSGGTAAGDAFYNLTHDAAGTVQMINTALLINNNFTNTTGPFNANNLNMTVDNTWDNTNTYTSGTNTVTLGGTNQQVLGSTSFYKFSKIVGAAATLTFDHLGLQSFANSLTMKGAAGQLLGIVSDLPGTQAHIALAQTGVQSIFFVDVHDSHAGIPPGDQTLIGRNASAGSPGQNNINWNFGGVLLTWTGTISTDWNDPGNWFPGIVPTPVDSVLIPPGPVNQPILTTPVTVTDLTLQAGASVTLNGFNLGVTSSFSNSGTIILRGTETVNLTQDIVNPGTFEYVGDGTNNPITIKPFSVAGSADYYNLVINDTNPVKNTFVTNSNIKTVGNVTVTSGTLDISTNHDTLTVNGTLSVNGANGVLTATNGNITDNGNFVLSAGTFTAPGPGKTFSVSGNFTNSGGTFNNSNGTVTFNGAGPTIITGNTTFYNFTSTTPNKVIKFTAGSNQTVTNTFTVAGVGGGLISLLSTVGGTSWNVTVPGGPQNVGELDVQDSNALNNTITCFNCTNGGHNNANWIFSNLLINAPAAGTTVGTTPTIIGMAPANTVVYLRDINKNLVATTKADANGNFRVAVGQDAANTGLALTTPMAVGANSLTPYPDATTNAPGLSNAVTVVANASSNQVPTITGINCPAGNPICGNIANPNLPQILNGPTPVLSGQGLAGENVTAQALDANGNLIETAVLGVVAGNGTYSVTFPTALTKGANVLSITVGSSANETTSALLQVILTDPFGYVYNSTTNLPIKGAAVTLFDNATKQPAVGVQSCTIQGVCSNANTFTTLADGFYSYLAPPGNYYIVVSAPGYSYPSQINVVPAGRFVVNGSKGEVFNVGNVVFELDLPLDANNQLLRITKTANKNEGSVGDVVMYTINIQNLSDVNAVTNVFLSDQIPPGFKYIKDRVLLNSSPIPDPSGQRPLLFTVGTVPAGGTVILQYQLVIGSGVTMGNYKNTAVARYANGLIISNPAQASVKITLDPVFDLGTAIGKVFFDWNENGTQDAPYFDPVSQKTVVESPVPNVQIVMEDGTTITTDADGKFSIPGLLPGRHLFRLDERTLPPGSYMTTDKTTIVDVTPGAVFKVNFGVNIDQSQAKNRDAVFFNQKIRLSQDNSRPVPRLNAALFNASADAKPDTEELLLYEGTLVRKAEFRIFTNYAAFFGAWHLDIFDADTHKLVRSFEGTPLTVHDPIYWDGRDSQQVIVNPDHKYAYVVTLTDDKLNRDETKEKPIAIRVVPDEAGLKKELEETKDSIKERATRYHQWILAQEQVNTLSRQTISVKGETVHLDRQGTDVKSIKVMRGSEVFMEVPLVEHYGLTPQELLTSGYSIADEKDNLEFILPNGDYALDVVSVKPGTAISASPSPAAALLGPASGVPPGPLTAPTPGVLERYGRPLKVGDDYLMFVALGDAQTGFNIDTGNIEPIQDKTQRPGFYYKGKGAYYLKGQILGKFLVTSSFDSDRAQKALFRSLDPNTYYPVYGDSSSVNYSAADTQGALYLLVQWDKSSAIWGNYVVDFKDTEFAAFSQKYYGGKIEYQSVANNPYGDPRTQLVVYHASVQQLPSHNEFLATGGSLYFLKFKNVVQGSETVTVEVRDQTTGLVLASQPMTNGADYEIDNTEGRILFWEPVAMIAQSENIISNKLIEGNPMYVVVNYQYQSAVLPTQGSQGARVSQALGNNLVLGGTFIQDNTNGQNYTLEGTDATFHVTSDATVKAEYAHTKSQESGSYVSTDGGISFTQFQVNPSASGQAYGIKGDARLFDAIGLKSYYKWIGADFGASTATSQQGKELMGLSLTFDMTPVTRLTASEDIQRLVNGGNLQTSAQVGASETDTTMIQIVHTAEKLKLTGAFQLVETKNTVNGIVSTTNQKGATIGGQAQYDVTSRLKLTVGQQVDVLNKNNTATTVGAAARITDMTTLNAQEVFSSQGRALTAGITNQIGKKIAVTADYTLANLNNGQINKTASVQVTGQVTKNIALTGNMATTSSSTGTVTNTASLGAKATVAPGLTMDMMVGKTQNALSVGANAQSANNISLNGTTQIGNTTVTGTAQAFGGTNVGLGMGSPANVSLGTTAASSLSSLTTNSNITATSSVGVKAVTKVNANTTTNGFLNLTTESTGRKTATFGFGNTSKLNQELQAVTDNSFSFSPDNGTTENSKYGLVRNVNGRQLEADFTKASANQPNAITQSNIFGLSGDVNDKLALNGSIERGKVQNLNATQTDRTDFTLGVGYVLKDTETAVERLKNSLKLELRIDKGLGTNSLRQYVLYDALEGKLTENMTANMKVDYSKTIDTTTGAKAEEHQQIILGMAYRPVNFDNLNLITEYSFQNGYGGGLQQADALNTNVLATRAQVFSAQAVYDLTDQWQLSEKIAYRILNEQDAGFQFTQTHTWLVIHRLNYKIDRNWTVSGEYRNLGQVEAKDNKQGVLLELTHDINNNTQLGIGWNFTKYSDDLTNLSYTSQGPFVRMTGKFNDMSPEEKARLRAKWLDAKINDWAWILIRKELAKKDSRIVLELNRMFALAGTSVKAGRLEEAKQIYKDIITAGQMMYDEASEYIRGRIAFEEDLVNLDKTARAYFRSGEYLKARKIWEKIVDDASKSVVK